jgi:hypothetical protein
MGRPIPYQSLERGAIQAGWGGPSGPPGGDRVAHAYAARSPRGGPRLHRDGLGQHSLAGRIVDRSPVGGGAQRPCSR